MELELNDRKALRRDIEILNFERVRILKSGEELLSRLHLKRRNITHQSVSYSFILKSKKREYQTIKKDLIEHMDVIEKPVQLIIKKLKSIYETLDGTKLYEPIPQGIESEFYCKKNITDFI